MFFILRILNSKELDNGFVRCLIAEPNVGVEEFRLFSVSDDFIIPIEFAKFKIRLEHQ